MSPADSSQLVPSPTPQERIRALLRSNIELDTQAAAELRSVQEHGPEELVVYDDWMVTSEAGPERARLQSERRKAADYVAACDGALTCHIRRLPNELLGYIFEYCEPDRDAKVALDPVYTLKRFHALVKRHLWLISGVCWRWHAIVTGTPSLWTHFSANLHLWGHEVVEQRTLERVLAKSLDRGVPCPLSFQIGAVTDKRAPDYVYTGVLRLLADHAHRWKVVSISFDDGSWPWLAHACGRLENLEVLDVQVGEQNPGVVSNPYLYALMPTFDYAPKLRRFAFTGDLRNLIRSMPWHQLELFTYSSCSNEQLLNPALLRCIPLAKLPPKAILCLRAVLEISHSSWTEMRPVPPIACMVHCLVLQLSRTSNETDDVSLGNIFASLSLPLVSQLHIAPRMISVPKLHLPLWSRAQFSALSERSGFGMTLRHLILFVEISVDDLLHALTDLIQLEELWITDPALGKPALITDVLLAGLTVACSDVLLPQLISLTVSTHLTFSDSVLRCLVESRVKSLDHSDMMFCLGLYCMGRDPRSVDAEVLYRFAELVDAGVLDLDMREANMARFYMR
ncbi:F-box domain-containing protein [Mycena indigotica]|uniref:F-box domain-containing protein n=1 Tax=Mycena indigotica TaxID=2126181 RepID=A0A8H6VQB8_9AGAR|nr:F-box domain-containing protein [Mycena indigotica]KAF7290162.1 F-box domain-containing protein [Mycena indigotica]